MSQSVFHHMADQKQRLLDRLKTNEEVCSIVMGLLGRLIYIAEMEINKPVLGISFDTLVVNGNEFKARVRFGEFSILKHSMWSPRNDFKEYVGSKAASMARAMDDNPELGKFFQDLVEHIDQYARFRGIPFRDLTFTQHVITKDFLIVLKVGNRQPQLV